MGPGGNDAGLSRVHLTRALEASLRRLGVEAVDLYQAHAWDPLTPLPETLRFFDDAVRAGKIRYAGVSNFTGWQLQKAALLTQHLNLTPIVTLQPQYNLLARDIEFELPTCAATRASASCPGRRWAAAGSPASTSGTRRRPAPPGSARTRTAAWRRTPAATPTSAPGGWSTRSREVAEQRGVSMAAVALAWLADRPAVTSVILGARTVEQLDDNLAAADLTLDAEQTRLLDEASAPAVADYPYGVPGVRQRGRDLPA